MKRTVYTLESTAGRHIYVVTVWAEEFYCVEARHIGAATWYDIATNTIDAWARAENVILVFIDLQNHVSAVSRLLWQVV